MNDDSTNSPKKLNGFAALPAERQREIARMGQAALKASGKRYTFTSDKAREAAKLGWARRGKTASGANGA